MISHNPPCHPVPSESHARVEEPPDQPDPQDTAFNHEYARFAIATSGDVVILVFGNGYCVTTDVFGM